MWIASFIMYERRCERARSPFRGLTSEPLRSPRLSSDVDRVLGVLKGIWAREGSNLRTSRMWTVRSNQLSYAPIDIQIIAKPLRFVQHFSAAVAAIFGAIPLQSPIFRLQFSYSINE